MPANRERLLAAMLDCPEDRIPLSLLERCSRVDDLVRASGSHAAGNWENAVELAIIVEQWEREQMGRMSDA